MDTILILVALFVNFALLFVPWQYNIINNPDNLTTVANFWKVGIFVNLFAFFSTGGGRMMDLLAVIFFGPIMTMSGIVLLISLRAKPIIIERNKDEGA